MSKIRARFIVLVMMGAAVLSGAAACGGTPDVHETVAQPAADGSVIVTAADMAALGQDEVLVIDIAHGTRTARFNVDRGSIDLSRVRVRTADGALRQVDVSGARGDEPFVIRAPSEVARTSSESTEIHPQMINRCGDFSRTDCCACGDYTPGWPCSSFYWCPLF